MAIEALYLNLLKQAIDRNATSDATRRGLLLAYPDPLVPRAAPVRKYRGMLS